MKGRPDDVRSLSHENAALRSRVSELERRLARFRAGEAAPAGVSLEEREALLSEAERIAHMGSWVWDPRSGAVVWSDEMFRIWGYEPDAVEPTLEVFYAGIHPDDMTDFQAASERGLATGEAEQVEFRVVRPTGEVRDVTMNSTLLFDEQGQLQRVVGTALDTTERNSLEEQLRHAQKMEAIGRLAGGVAHDFNNLLTVVLGSASLMQTKIKCQELSDITNAARSAASLTRQLLAFGRRAVLDRRPLDLNKTIQASKGLLAQALGTGIKLEFDLAPDLWPARLDESQVQQILVNLTVNARDAMPGGGRLTVRTRNVPRHTTMESDTDGVLLSVIDTGTGMDEGTLERVFEPFFTTKPAGVGTGLGLSMVFGAVQQSGGTIAVQSEPGGGSTFQIYFPRDAEQAQAEATSAVVPLPLERLKRGVLAVDDDVDVLRVVASCLRARGIDVTEESSPGRALHFIQSKRFDLLISDMAMPAMPGQELAQRAWGEDPSLPVLFITGLAPNGAADLPKGRPWLLLRKPFRGEDLVAAVSEVLANHTR